ncbi:hypothetical protein [Hydrogenimonas sp.]
MTRRSFISRAAAASLVPTFFLSGCGSGGGGASNAGGDGAPQSRATDVTLESLHSRNAALEGTLNEMHAAGAATVGGAATARSFLRSLESSGTEEFFHTRTPDGGYLAGEEAWERYLAYQALAHEQYKHQFAKMAAALRVAGYKSEGALATRSVSLSARDAALVTLRETDTDLLQSFEQLVDRLAEGNFSATIVDLLTVSLKVLHSTLETLLAQDKIKGLAYTVLTYLAVDRLLEIVKEKSLEGLDFESDENIVLSLGKMAIAAIALFGLMSYEKMEEGVQSRAVGDGADDEAMVAFLQNVVLQGQLVTVLTGFLTQVMTQLVEDTQTTAQRLRQSLEAGYELSDEDRELVASLKLRSKMLALFGLALKSLFALLTKSGFEAEAEGFRAEGDAADFSFLFGSQINPYDETFNAYLHDLLASLPESSDTGSLSLWEAMEALSTQAYNFTVQSESDAYDFTVKTETDAYNFAMHLADLAHDFTSETESDAYDFATHMADLAYAFTMKMEDDAYRFALQGMEWGYLFASRGEEVGIMADRVLYMAVQIGQMADRIGEMADRIVYTEQLIVYTEMLILDFGLLIYGGMKAIVNLVLTGLALILDRKWYKPQAKDQIVELIGKQTENMMADMQEYALTVVENQNTLRLTTQAALEWMLEVQRIQASNDANATAGNG